MNDDPEQAVVPADELQGRALKRLFADARIVRREVLENAGAVRERLEEARAAADELLRGAEQEAAAIRERARRAGHQEGIRQTLEHVAAAERARADARRAAESEMLDLAFQLAERVLGRAIALDDDAFADLVADKLRAARAAPSIVVRVAPAAAIPLEGSRERLAAAVDGVPITVEPDDSLRPGDCIIETDRGRIDARIRVQLDALRDALKPEERDD